MISRNTSRPKWAQIYRAWRVLAQNDSRCLTNLLRDEEFKKVRQPEFYSIDCGDCFLAFYWRHLDGQHDRKDYAKILIHENMMNFSLGRPR